MYQVEGDDRAESAKIMQPRLYTWVYRVIGFARGKEIREYLAGTAGRIRVCDARTVADALNEYSLTMGEGK